MVFSSLYFTFFFLPVVVLMYYISKEKYRNYILLIASLYFYSYGEPTFVFVMLASIIANYLLAISIDNFKQKGKIKYAKLILCIDVLLNIGLLFVFKYLDFTISATNMLIKTSINVIGIALPIGISFFTFQAMSYVIDVYKGSVKVQKNLFYLALYISFFPQLVAGPIVRYSTVEKQIIERVCTKDKFAEGVRRFFLGFSKKVILANNLATVAEDVFAMNPKETNPLLLWIGAICFSLQIFYDFSGYSDMAIGLGKIFGFEFEENFNYPYVAKSITDFWRRWHISLSRWFRDYVYIPLGGSRVSIPKHIFNMLVVWMLTGIWHGANYTFIAWGLGYFVLLVIEKYIIKPEDKKNIILKAIWRVVTLLCVNFLWVIFNSKGIVAGLQYCLGMMFRYHIEYKVPMEIDNTVIRYMREYGMFILLGILFATPIMKWLGEKLENEKISGIISIIKPIGYSLIFVWAVSFVIVGVHNPFIYFNF